MDSVTVTTNNKSVSPHVQRKERLPKTPVPTPTVPKPGELHQGPLVFLHLSLLLLLVRPRGAAVVANNFRLLIVLQLPFLPKVPTHHKTLMGLTPQTRY